MTSSFRDEKGLAPHEPPHRTERKICAYQPWVARQPALGGIGQEARDEIDRAEPSQFGRLDELGLGDRVEIRVADGSLGDPAGPLYDGIIVTAAAPAIPAGLRDQLADGGRLVIPVGPRDLQTLTLVVRRGNDWLETPHGACVFVPLVGPGGFPE